MNDKQVLVELYKEQCAHGRHHEVQRTSMSNIILLLSVMIIGLVTYDMRLNAFDIAPLAFVAILGVFGSFFSIKYNERFRLHMRRARGLRREISKLTTCAAIEQLLEDANRKHKSSNAYNRIISKTSLTYWWVCLHAIISFLGFVLILIVIFI